MGWRDRDWAKFDDDELHALLAPRGAGTGRTSGRRTAGGTTLLAVGISAAAVILFTQLHTFGGPGHAAARALSPVPTIVDRSPADVVAIHWGATDTLPAQQAGRICVTDASHGEICAAYAVGERPADDLTREIERRGLRVRSSG